MRNAVALEVIRRDVGNLPQGIVFRDGKGHVAAVEDRRHLVFDGHVAVKAQLPADPVAEEVHIARRIGRLGLDLPPMAFQVSCNGGDGDGLTAVDGNQYIIFRNNMPNFHRLSFLSGTIAGYSSSE